MSLPASRRERWRDLLAAEYVIGTLRGAARRRMLRWINEDAATRTAVERWERRMYLLTDVAPVTPSAGLWPRIFARLSEADKRSAQPARPALVDFARRQPPVPKRSLGRRLMYYAAAASIAAIAAGVTWQLLPQSAPPAPAPVVATAPTPAPTQEYTALLGPKDRNAYWWVRIDIKEHKMLVVTLSEPIIPSNRAPELWIIPKGGKPISMGMLPRYADKAGAMPKMPPGAAMDGAQLAVSLEPPGGSPSGAPTGPVVFAAPLGKA